MFDVKYVREHAEEIRESLQRRKDEGLVAVLDDFLEKEAGWRKLKVEVDTLRSKRNELSRAVNEAKKAGEDVKPIIAQVKEVPAMIKKVEARMDSLYEQELRPLLRRIPNVMHERVPYGADEAENVELKKWGVPTKHSFTVKNHVVLCEENGWADFEASAATTGNGFYFLKGDLALLNQALITFAIEKMRKKGYEYVEPPLMVREPILEAAMDLDGIKESVYTVNDGQGSVDGDVPGREPLCLIGTAEHALLGLHADETFKAEALPKKYVGYSMCFRKEIGSHGINEKGLWRTHQFNKVEQFVYALPEQSWDLFDELLANSEEIMQALELPYRVVEMCTGDLSLWKARAYDIEVWRPTTESYGEVMSLSNCTAYQATDLHITFVRKNQERGTVHTLNNTALATSRIMVALLENHQNKDGSVNVPKALQPFMNGVKKLSPRK